jgi:hypothetical protein
VYVEEQTVGALGQLEAGRKAGDVARVPRHVTQTSTPHIVCKMDFPAPNTAHRAYRVPSPYLGVTWQ